jgi:hypothetical protein
MRNTYPLQVGPPPQGQKHLIFRDQTLHEIIRRYYFLLLSHPQQSVSGLVHPLSLRAGPLEYVFFEALREVAREHSQICLGPFLRPLEYVFFALREVGPFRFFELKVPTTNQKPLAIFDLEATETEDGFQHHQIIKFLLVYLDRNVRRKGNLLMKSVREIIWEFTWFVRNSLFMLHKLIKLSLSHNLITSLSSELIAKLSSLQSLDASYNHLSSLPSEISQLTSLTQLNLRNNLLENLPESLGTMSQLTTLYLVNNQLKEYPERILAKNQNLLSWNVSNNQIHGCYDEFLKNTTSVEEGEEEDREQGEGEKQEGKNRTLEEGAEAEEEKTMKIESIRRKNHKLFVELEQEIFQRNIAQNQMILTNSSPTTTKRDSDRRRIREFYDRADQKNHGSNSKSFWKTIDRNASSGQIIQSTSDSAFAMDPLCSTIFPDDLIDTLDIGKDFLKYVKRYETLSGKIRRFRVEIAENATRHNLETKKGTHSNDSKREVFHRVESSIQEQYEVAMDSEVDKLLQESRSMKSAFRLSLSSKGPDDAFQQKLIQLRGSPKHAVVEEVESFEGEGSIKSHNDSLARSQKSENQSQASSLFSRHLNQIEHQGSNNSLQSHQSAHSSQQRSIVPPSNPSNFANHQDSL